MLFLEKKTFVPMTCLQVSILFVTLSKIQEPAMHFEQTADSDTVSVCGFAIANAHKGEHSWYAMLCLFCQFYSSI